MHRKISGGVCFANVRATFLFCIATCLLARSGVTQPGRHAPTVWPAAERQMRPWTRWWWMGNAVDAPNIQRLLRLYAGAGFGGVEITPIYGARGFEYRYIDFLSARWMEMLRLTVRTADALDMGVDMNTGTGWPFGGPQI